MKKLLLLSLCSAALSHTALAVENYSLSTKISSVHLYPQPVTPDGVKYTELLISIPQNMAIKPSCAAHGNRFIIDSNNPMFPYVYGLALQAKKEQVNVSINYWDKCETSGTHKAPVIRSISSH